MHHNRNVFRLVLEIAVAHGDLPPSEFFRYLPPYLRAVSGRRGTETG
jgi:hypothetical protein